LIVNRLNSFKIKGWLLSDRNIRWYWDVTQIPSSGSLQYHAGGSRNWDWNWDCDTSNTGSSTSIGNISRYWHTLRELKQSLDKWESYYDSEVMEQTQLGSLYSLSWKKNRIVIFSLNCTVQAEDLIMHCNAALSNSL
jgi:hypothetical protein